MTPRELWEAAVRLQQQASCALDDLPATEEAGEAPLPGIVNTAVAALHEAYAAARAAGSPPTNGEWQAAYSIHRDAMLAWGRRRRSQAALEDIDAVVDGSRDFYQLARRYFE